MTDATRVLTWFSLFNQLQHWGYPAGTTRWNNVEI